MANAVNEPFVPSGTSGQLQVGGFVIVSGASVSSLTRTDWQGTLTLSPSSRTNYMLQTQDTSTGWTLTGGATKASTDAPSGSGLTAVRIGNLITYNTDSYKLQSDYCSTNDANFLSFWVRPVSTTGTIRITNISNNAYGWWTIDLTQLTVGVWQKITVSHPSISVTHAWAMYSGYAGIQIDSTDGVARSIDFAAPTVSQGDGAFIPTTTAAVSVTDYSYTGAGVVTLGQTASGTYVWNGSGVLTAGTSGASGVLDGRTRNLVPMDGITIGPASPTATSAVTLTGKISAAGSSTQTNSATSAVTLTGSITGAGTGSQVTTATSAVTLTGSISAAASASYLISATSAVTLTGSFGGTGISAQTNTATSSATLTTKISAAATGTYTYIGTSAATLTTYISASGSSTQTNSATSAATLTTSISSSGSSTQTNSGNSSVSLTTSISAAGTGAQGNVGTSAVSLTGSITAAGSSIQTNTGTSAISLAGSIAASGTASFGGDVAVNVNGSVITFTPGKVTVPDAKTIIQTFGPLGGGGGRVIKEEKSKEKKKSKLVTSNLIRVKGSEASFNCGTVRVEIEIPPIYSKRRTVKGSEMSLTAGSVSVGIEYELQNDDEDLMQILDLLELI